VTEIENKWTFSKTGIFTVYCIRDKTNVEENRWTSRTIFTYAWIL